MCDNLVELKESFCDTSCKTSSLVAYLIDISFIINTFITIYETQKQTCIHNNLKEHRSNRNSSTVSMI